jgi:TPR repeat protein
MHENGEGVSKDDATSYRWYLSSAQQDNQDAQLRLGQKFLHGVGVIQNRNEGLKWLLKAVYAGYDEAQLYLGIAYFNGHGVETDYARAGILFRLAATQGNTNAQGFLGWMCLKGLGTQQDKNKAIRWFLRSAEQNNSTAQIGLGISFMNDDAGSFPDLISSYYWFRLAKINGGRNSDTWLDYLTECMSKSQIDQAEKRVSDWLASQSEKSE